MERMSNNGEGKFRTPIEVFSGLKPAPLSVRPMPIAEISDKEALGPRKTMVLTVVSPLHMVLDNVHKDVPVCNHAKRKPAQLVHNAGTNFQPINSIVGDFVMVCSTKK